MSYRGSISPPYLPIGNCRTVLPDVVLDNACITITKGAIKEIYPGSLPLPDNRTRLLDAGGKFVVPGFIDVNCHGDGTTNFLHDAEKVSRNLLRQGVTTVFPAIGYSDMNSAIADQLRDF